MTTRMFQKPKSRVLIQTDDYLSVNLTRVAARCTWKIARNAHLIRLFRV